MNEIIIRGLEIDARHGVHRFEKENSQKFVFDIDLKTDFYRAAKFDDLSLTCSYSDVCNLVAKIAAGNSFNLIETLAYECAFAVMYTFAAFAVKLTVFKPEAPVKHKFGNVGVTVEIKRKNVYLSLGSSLGDRKNYLDSAIKLLDGVRGITVKKVSSYIQSEPYGGVAKNTFLNCAAQIETCLAPMQLLDEIHSIEKACGRVRDVRWGDRTLDIDVIFYGDEIICDGRLTVPHPEYYKRDFVLIPLKEIAPGFVCPLLKKRIADI